MKKEASKKSKLWLWLVIGAVVLVAAGVAAFLLLPGLGAKDKGPDDGRPDLYWNIDKAVYTENSESGLSTREPGEDGVYHVRFAIDGEIKEIPVVDKRLINYIDTLDAMGLELDQDGAIVDVIDPKTIAKEVTKNAYVQVTAKDLITANSSVAMNGMKIKIELNELTEIYDVTRGAEIPGKIISVDELAAMDTLTVYANDKEQVTHVYVTAHSRQSKVYWRADQMYNSTEKSTTREVDENGAYTIPFFCEGEVVELKTKDKALATKIDSVSRWKCHFGLAFDEEGYIVEQFVSSLGIQGVIVADCWDVVDIQGDEYTIQRLTTNDGSVWSGTIPADCVIYEAGIKAKQEGQGGRRIDSLQLGDRVTVWTDTNGQVVLVYVAERLVDSPAYWMTARKYKTAEKTTTRVPNANGYYEVELVKEGTTGKQTYYVKDKETMSYIDSQTSKIVGLKVLPGNIVEFAYSSEALTGYTVATRGGVVTNITGGIFTKMTYGKRGTESNMVLAANARVYNVSAYGTIGEPTTIQPGDHVYACRQPTGEILLAYVTKRTIGGEHLYWNLDKQYDSTKKVSTRVPDADGWYHLLFAYKGQQVTLKTKNFELVNKIDALSIGATALEVSGDVITNVVDATYAYGGNKVASGYRYRYVTAEGKYFCVYNSDENKTVEFTMADDCVIYNVSTVFKSHQGERIYSIPYNSMLTVFCDIYGEAKVVYVRTKYVDNMYWKTETLYDSTNKVTKRTPDADGYYWYDLAVNGECKTFKTKDQKIANSMDSYNGAFGLNVVDDEIKGFVSVSNVKNVKGNGVNGYNVTAINGNTITLTYNKPTSSFGKTETITLSKDVKIYDVTPSSPTFGAAIELKVGDTVRTYLSTDEKTHNYVYVMARSTRAGGETGWCEVCQKNVTWNPVLGSISITGATGHWYVTQDMTQYVQYSFASDSKDPSKNYTICLDLNGHTLTRSENGRSFRVAYNETLNIMDSVGGGKIVSGGGNSYNGGLIMMSSAGVVNMYGGTLEVVESEYKSGYGGNVYMSGKGTTFNLYNGVVTGGISYAENKSEPGYGGNFYIVSGATLNMYDGEISNGRAYGIYDTTTNTAVAAYGGNIYMSESSMVNIYGGVVKDGEAVRETFEYTVNGETKTAANMSYGGNIYKVNTNKLDGRLLIDGGTVTGGKAHRGGNINAYAGSGGKMGIVELRNATISDGYATQFGGNIMSNCANWTIVDSTITGGISDANGGNIYSQGGVYTVEGSTISDGQANGGGNIYLYKNKYDDNIFTIKDGTVVENGVSTAHGGNIYVKNKNYVDLNGKIVDPKEDVDKVGIPLLPTLNVEGGQIIGGTCAAGSYGGNIYCAGNMNLTGGTISGGKAGSDEYDIYVPGEFDATINVGSVNVAGKFRFNGGKEIYIYDAPVLGQLNFAKNIKAVIGEIKTGADIKVVTTSGSPVFTTSFEDAQDYVDAGYFSGYKLGDVVTVTAESELSLEAAPLPTKDIFCNHCGQTVTFEAWTAESGEYLREDGHYYLLQDATLSANYRIGNSSSDTAAEAANVVVDLNGFNITSTGPAFYVYPYSTLTMQDSVGTGVVTGAGVIRKDKPGDGGVFYVEKGNLNIYSGTYTLTDTDKVSNGGVIRNGGTTKIYGGTLNGNTINGLGSAIYSTNTLEISGGTVNGETYIKSNFAVSGDPVIENLIVPTGTAITVGEMLSGADITVTAEGVFTKPNTNAQAYVDAGYFTSATSEPITVNVLNEMAIGTVIIEGQMDYACPHCNGAVATWIPYNANDVDGTIVGNNTHYYIPEGGYAQTYGQVSIQGSVILDLHGETLTGKDDKRLWRVEGEFSILDTVGGGQAVADGLPGGGGALAMTRKNPTTGDTAVINLYSGTLTMTADCNAGGSGGILNLAGGTVMNMYGGEIYGGKATNEHAQNVYISDGSLNMQGGFIDGGVELSKNGTLNLSGDAKIAANNGGLWIAEGKHIGLGAMDAAEIYVATANTATITDTLSNADEYLDNIKAAEAGWTVENYGGALLLTNGEKPFDPNTVHEQAKAMDFTTTDPDGKVTAKCPVCREEVEWLPLEANNSGKSVVMTGGHYYLSESIDYTANNYQYSFTTQETLCLNLNGQNLTSTARVFYTEKVGTVLNVMGEGTVTGAGYMTSGKWYSAFDLTTDANFYGGTYVSTTQAPAIGNRKSSSGEALVSIYEGTTVVNENIDGLAMYVLSNGSLAINGGTVNGIVLDSNSKGITVSGKPVVNYIDLTAGTLLNVEGLTTGADITVDAVTVFTKDLTDANAVVGYFKATGHRVVVVSGSALTVAAAAPEKSIYEQAKEMVFTTSEPDGKVTAICPVCETEQTWLPMPAADAENVANPDAVAANKRYNFEMNQHHHFYLDPNVDYTKNVGFYAVDDAQICLNLNGQSIVSSARAFWNEGKTTVVNIMGDGSVTGNGYNSNATTWRAAFDGTAAYNLYGGTYASANDYPVFDMRSSSNENCILGVYEGTVITPAVNECAIRVTGKSGVQIYGGTINGSVVKAVDTAVLTIEGNPVIQKLDLTNGMTVEIGELTEGASIYVEANGVFTSSVADAAAAMEYFTVAAGKKLTVEAGNLSVVDDTPVVCPHCGKSSAEIEWTPWTFAYGKGTQGTITSGHYYMTADVTGMDGYYYIGTNTDDDVDGRSVDVVLDMRGFDLQSSTRVFYGYTNNDLTLWDSVGGSTLQGGLATSAGGTIFFGDGGGLGKLSFYNINIVDGTTTTREKNGGVLFLSGDAELVMDNCVLTAHSAQNGCAIAVSSGVATITNSVVTGGAAKEKGGAIYMSGAGQIVIENSTINSGSAATGKGVYLPKDGALVITDSTVEDVFVNHAQSSTTVSGNVTIGCLDLSSGAVIDATGLTGGDITVVAEGVFTTDLTDAAAAQGFFKSGVSGMNVVIEGAALAIAAETVEPETNVYEAAKEMDFSAGGTVTAKCPACGVNHNWEPLPAPTSSSKDTLAAGAYYVAEDMEVTKFWYTKEGSGTICINLNGKAITNTADRVFYVEGKTTVLNIMGEGTVTGTGKYNSANFNYVGSALDMTAAVNLYGGSWKSTNEYPVMAIRGANAYSQLSIYEGTQIVRTEEDAAGLNIYIADGSSVNMNGGLISGGTAIEHAALAAGKVGGNVLMKVNTSDKNLAYTCTFNMNGGVLENGVAEVKGGNIAVVGNALTNPAGSINISGGEIKGGSVYATGANASITVSGAPVVDYLDMVDANLLTVGELTEGAAISVAATKEVPFTNTIEANAETYATYFTGTQLKEGVVAKENALVLTDVCPHCNVPMADITWTEIGAVEESHRFTESGHYKMTQDITNKSGNVFTMNEATSLDKGIHVVIDTCGFDVTSAGRVLYVNKFNATTIFDSVGGSVLRSVSTTAALGGSGLYVHQGALLNVYDVTVYGSPDAHGNGNCLSIYGTNGVMNIYSGSFYGNDDPTKAEKMGGVVYNRAGTLNIYGGTFGTALLADDAKGDCIYNDKILNIYGGEFAGEIYMDDGSEYTIAEGLDLSALIVDANT